jgi:chromosomal replication initiator protein
VREEIVVTDPDLQIWKGCLAHLRSTHPALCRQWFDELEPLSLQAGTVTVRALTGVHRDYLAKRCREQFNEAIQAVSGRLITVRFVGPEDETAIVNGSTIAETKPAPIPSRAARMDESSHESIVINPDNDFETFVVGPNNRLAHAAAKAVAQSPASAYNPLFIHGDVGLGKTHLLQAICLSIAERRPGTVMRYLSCEGFVTQFIEAVQAGRMAEFRHVFRDVDVLVIDDIHFLTRRDRTQEEFFHTFNSLYQASKQIILSSDAPPEDIPDLEERLVSRFKWGLVVNIEPPGYETRVAIVKSKAALRDFPMPDAVACYIADSIDSNIRELEGAITRVQIQAQVENRPADLEMARVALGNNAAPTGGLTLPAIANTVTGYYSIRLTDLQSKKRQRSIALPRQVCMHLARRLTRHSLEEIGGFFGGRDHTTVMHAIRAIDTRMEADEDFRAVVHGLEQDLRRPGGR